MNVKSIRRAVLLSVALALVSLAAPAQTDTTWRNARRKASDTDRGDKGRGSETGLLEQVVDDEPELCPE